MFNGLDYTTDMGRIMAIDYGQKRCGIAVTDPLQLFATGLETVASHKLIEFLSGYFVAEQVDCVVVGEPKDMNNQASDASRFIEPFVRKLQQTFPGLIIERYR